MKIGPKLVGAKMTENGPKIGSKLKQKIGSKEKMVAQRLTQKVVQDWYKIKQNPCANQTYWYNGSKMGTTNF